MAGQYTKGNIPKRPGAYFNYSAQQPTAPVVGTDGIVALVAQHNWGPANQVVTLNGWGDFIATYGDGASVSGNVTGAYRAVRDAFRGEDVPGYAGAAQVLFYRIAGTGSAAGSKALSNGTAGAITLTARYPGTYAAQISLTVVADLNTPATTDNLVVYVEGSEVERYVYAKTNITDLAAQINGTAPYTPATASDWVTAGAVTTGTALTPVTQSALTGGNDGAALTPTDYTTAQNALNVYRFSVLAFDNMIDSSVLAAQKTWAVNLNAKGKRFVTVVGGALGETMATAVARSGTLNDPNFVNVGGGTYSDADYGQLSTAQLVGRIAGIIAQRGEGAEITFARLRGLSIVAGATDSDILSALNGGVVAISRDSNTLAPVRLELGLTTYTTTTDVNRPLSIFGNLKFVRVLGGIEMELTEWAEETVIGRMPVNDATRDFVRGHVEAVLAGRERDSIIQPGWVVGISADPPPQPTDTFVSVDYSVELERGIEQVLNNVTVG